MKRLVKTRREQAEAFNEGVRAYLRFTKERAVMRIESYESMLGRQALAAPSFTGCAHPFHSAVRDMHKAYAQEQARAYSRLGTLCG